MQNVSKPLHGNYNLPKFKGVQDGQLDPKDPVNASRQTNQKNG